MSQHKDQILIFEAKDESLFGFPMQIHATNQKIGRIKWQNGWISVIDSYLTLSHLSILKDDGNPKQSMDEGKLKEKTR